MRIARALASYTPASYCPGHELAVPPPRGPGGALGNTKSRHHAGIPLIRKTPVLALHRVRCSARAKAQATAQYFRPAAAWNTGTHGWPVTCRGRAAPAGQMIRPACDMPTHGARAHTKATMQTNQVPRGIHGNTDTSRNPAHTALCQPQPIPMRGCKTVIKQLRISNCE